jgi:hypothetical protein
MGFYVTGVTGIHFSFTCFMRESVGMTEFLELDHDRPEATKPTLLPTTLAIKPYAN